MSHFEVNLSDKQKALHQKALILSKSFRKCEYELVEVLREVDQLKLFRHFGYASLFKYAVNELKLSEPQAYSFITVARKTLKISALDQPLKNGTLTVSKATRIASCLTPENAEDLISYAKAHTSREIDLEVSRRNPEAPIKQSVKLESDESVRLSVSLSHESYEKVKRVQDLLAQKGKVADLALTIEVLLDEYLLRHDPVIKAKRIMAKKKSKAKSQKSASNAGQITLSKQSDFKKVQPKPYKVEVRQRETSDLNSVTKDAFDFETVRRNTYKAVSNNIKTAEAKPNFKPKRAQIPAAIRHQLYLEQEGRCSFVDARGKRCTNSRYLHIHHIRPVSMGGGNDPENLSLLCASHHELVHQLSFPIEGQMSWLRSAVKDYLVI